LIELLPLLLAIYAVMVIYRARLLCRPSVRRIASKYRLMFVAKPNQPLRAVLKRRKEQPHV
jgi:hypothetical protein